MPVKPLTKITLGALAVGLAIFAAHSPLGVSAAIIWPCLLLFYLCFLYTICRNEVIHNKIRTYIRADVLFLVFYYLIFFYQYQLQVLGLADVAKSRFGFIGQIFPDQANQAVLICTSGAVAFTLGLITKFRPPSDPNLSGGKHPDALPGIETAILTAQFGFISLYILAGWQSAGEGRYTGTTSGGVLAEGVATLILMFCMMSAAVLIARVRDKRRINLSITLSSLVTAYWCFRLLSTGDRNNLLLILIVYGAGFATFIRPIGRVLLFSILAFGLIMYNSIEAIRMTGDITFDSLVEAAFAENNASGPSDSSFNITTVSLRASLAAIPDQYPFGFGIYKVAGFLGFIPLIRGFIIGDDWVFTTSSDINTYVLLGPHAIWGVGTNIISDIYVDFGFIMIPVVLFILGWVCQKCSNFMSRRQNSTSASVFYLLFVALFSELPRYALDFPIRILVWSFLFVMLYRICLRMFGNNGKAAATA